MVPGASPGTPQENGGVREVERPRTPPALVDLEGPIVLAGGPYNGGRMNHVRVYWRSNHGDWACAFFQPGDMLAVYVWNGWPRRSAQETIGLRFKAWERLRNGAAEREEGRCGSDTTSC